LGLTAREAFLCPDEVIFGWQNQISDITPIYFLKNLVQKWGKVKQTARNRAFFVEFDYPQACASVLK